MKKLLMLLLIFLITITFTNGKAASGNERSWYQAIPKSDPAKVKEEPDPPHMIKKYVYPSGLKIVRYIDKDNCVGISWVGQKGDRDICEIISYPYGGGVQQSYSRKTKFEELGSENKYPGEIIIYKNGKKIKREIIEFPDGKVAIRITDDYGIDEEIIYPYSSPRIKRGIDPNGTVVDWDTDGYNYFLRRITYPDGHSQAIKNLQNGLIIRKKEKFPKPKNDGSNIPYLVPEPYPKYVRGVEDMGYYGQPPVRKGFKFIFDMDQYPEELTSQSSLIKGTVMADDNPKSKTKYYTMVVERVRYSGELYYSVEEIKELSWEYKDFDWGYTEEKNEYQAPFEFKLHIYSACSTAELAFFVLDEDNLAEFKRFKGENTYQIPARTFELYNIREKSLDGTDWVLFTHKCKAELTTSAL